MQHTVSLRRYISLQMRNVRRVRVPAHALVHHQKHAAHVVVADLLQTTRECFRSRSLVAHVTAMASSSKTHVQRVAELELNVAHVR